jgi:hypothetical protein
VRPTLADGDAISVREAIALGRRVVATSASARPPGVHLCRAGSASDLARAMKRALAAEPPKVRVGGGPSAVLSLYRRLGLEAPCAESLAV